MKLYKQIFFILIVFLKTETLLSENNLFNVNNIKIERNAKISNKALADQAIKKGFTQLIAKILLIEDVPKISTLKFSTIKELVTYYQVANISDDRENKEFVNFSVTFDKDKIHKLFYEKGILYSEILDKELFILPILLKEKEIYVFNNNFFYKNWNIDDQKNNLIEFVLLSENIEVIQKINKNENNLINLEIKSLFQEYPDKNLALILIEENQDSIQRVYIKSFVQGKKISKSLNFKKDNFKPEKLYEKIIIKLKKELENLVKSANLIDIRTPSFLNVKLDLGKKNNLVEINERIKNIDSIENVFVQEFNKDTMKMRIKYLGKLEKIINQLKNENINLKIINDQWVIKAL